jgi:hypothetical protein
MKRKIPIGLSDFKRIVEEDYYYVDKSLFIEEVIKDGSTIILIPRPRRFGKTLNMLMLKYFFEKSKEDNSVLFHKLKVWDNEENRKHQGKYPIVFLSFKDVKYLHWEDCIGEFKILLQYLFGQHRYLLESDQLDDENRTYFMSILNETADIAKLSTSIQKLCELLYNFHGVKPIILLDEYDTPIYSAWTNGYYSQLIDFMRNLMSKGLKDNLYLEKAILTGIMRVGKESIFSGMNNLKVATLIREDYSDKFGFTEEETINLLDEIGVEYNVDDVRDWYNGYVFGKTVIYNPWSIINYADSYKEDFRPHWVNTGSSDLIRDILTRAGTDVKLDMEMLISGGEIEKVVYENTVITEIEESAETVWSFLLFSGYLKAVNVWREGKKTVCKLKIPNKELEYVFEEIIYHWIKSGVVARDFELMLKSLVNDDVKTFGRIFRDIVTKSLSYFDVGGNEPERFYHAFVLGMMMTLTGKYQVKSNRESGYGRYDVMLIPNNKSLNGVVMEFKKVDTYEDETLETGCQDAIKQIREKNYRSELEALGVVNIIEVGVAFLGKDVKVLKA